MTKVAVHLKQLTGELAAVSPPKVAQSFGRRLANALGWSSGESRLEEVTGSGLPGDVIRASSGGQPGILFLGHRRSNAASVLPEAALYAYHSTIDWGVVTNATETIVFNSRWVRDREWYSLPPMAPKHILLNAKLFEALTPEGLTRGLIDQVALGITPFDKQLVPVDDALVDRLDLWRDESLRQADKPDRIDESIQTLFAQLFVLRAVEDRELAKGIENLRDVLEADGSANLERLGQLFVAAERHIQSDLFQRTDYKRLPPFVLGGIIKDLYVPSHLPGQNAKYNFAWISADVLGRAYEKYLSSVLIPSRRTEGQLRLFNQPLREVERVSRRKSAGVYYTPSYVVRYLTKRCLDDHFERRPANRTTPPRIADFACGSGSFLTAAADEAIRRLREIDPARNWGRELVTKRCLIGIDSDERAVTLARLSLWLRLAEEPKPLPLPKLEQAIICGDSLSDAVWAQLPAKYDVVLGNPPFLATGNVESRRSELEKRFRTAQGRFDYAYLFVELSLARLDRGGVVGLVVPNRLFRNRDAGPLREILGQDVDLLAVADFGSNEVFLGANVYVGLLVARRRGKDDAPAERLRFIRVHRLPPRFAGAELAAADAAPNEFRDEFAAAFPVHHPRGAHAWLMLSPKAVRARATLDDQSDPLSAIANVAQGIKTGANDIFIVDAFADGADSPLVTIRNGVGDTHVIERGCIRPVVFGSDIRRYDVTRPTTKMLVYPYASGSLIAERDLRAWYPNAHKYLTTYRGLLDARVSISASRRAWYELVRERGAAWLDSKKLLIRDLALKTSFAIDPAGVIAIVGGTAIVPADAAHLEPLMGYLNSRLANWYLNQMTPEFRAGFQKFEPQHLERMPVLRQVVEDGQLRTDLTALVQAVLQARQAGDESAQREAEREIDALLCTSVGVSPAELD